MGSPSQAQVMYGLAGERRLRWWELDWLPGYEGSRPVHVGNAAHQQLRIDVFGELPEAGCLFERLLAPRNDLSLLCEEYDPAARRVLGNFPQAFSHVSLVNTACTLDEAGGAPVRPPNRTPRRSRKD